MKIAIRDVNEFVYGASASSSNAATSIIKQSGPLIHSVSHSYLMWGWWINFVGIFASVGGALLLFLGTPKARPEIIHGAFLTVKPIINKEHVDEDKRRETLSKWGFGIVLFGFVLQLISQLFQYPR